jgi:hypothetical protein
MALGRNLQIQTAENSLCKFKPGFFKDASINERGCLNLVLRHPQVNVFRLPANLILQYHLTIKEKICKRKFYGSP